MMPAGCAPRALLDIGTGTGIVPSTFAGIFKTLDAFAGCDLSLVMPQQCRSKAKRSMWSRPVLFYRIFANIEERSTKYIVF